MGVGIHPRLVLPPAAMLGRNSLAEIPPGKLLSYIALRGLLRSSV